MPRFCLSNSYKIYSKPNSDPQQWPIFNKNVRNEKTCTIELENVGNIGILRWDKNILGHAFQVPNFEKNIQR